VSERSELARAAKSGERSEGSELARAAESGERSERRELARAAESGERSAQRHGSMTTAELVFAPARDGRTFVRHARVEAPLAFTRAFPAPDDPFTAIVWLQSTAGVLRGGDDVSVRLVVEPRATVRAAPQSALVVLGSGGGRPARSTLELVVEDGATLEWVPPPTVLLPGARLDTSTHLVAAAGALLSVVELFTCHVPSRTTANWAVADPTWAALAAQVDLVVDGRLAARDRIRTDGPWPVEAHGSAWFAGPGAEQLGDQLLACGVAAGTLPNGAGTAVRFARRATRPQGTIGLPC
jgi:urease accessory protein UreH